MEPTDLEYPEATYLPVLYSIDKSGKERMWKVWVIGDTVHWTSGLVDGKKQFYKRSYVGVNKGRKNETTAEEQAKLQMERMWTKQLDKNYVPKCKEGKAIHKRVMDEKKKHGGNNRTASSKISGGSSAKTSKTSKKKPKNLTVSDVEVPIIPMKAQVWTLKDPSNPKSVLPRVSKHFDFDNGVYVQWKLDGFRCTARLQSNGDVVLTSNTNKQYPWFVNLRKEVKTFLRGCLYYDALDCEVYAHRIEDSDGEGFADSQRFSTIQSICGMARTNPHPLEDQICLYVFDLVDISGEADQDERFATLKKLFKRGHACPHIKMVETRVVEFPEEIHEWHGKFAQAGYEGIVIRDRDLRYRLKHRSLKMRKFKHFIDEEYQVVDVHLNSGVDREYFVWVCQTEDGKRFKAKPMGPREDKWKWYDNRSEYIGRRLTVKFQEYTEDRVPRFPIAVKIREEWDG